MSRYQALADFLASKKSDEWEASFADIESRLGRRLPQSAYKYPAWWANQSGEGHSQTRGWRSVGWRTSALDLKARRVRFERERIQSPPRSLTDPGDRDDLIRQAQDYTGIQDREALIREALRALIAREAALRLARLGGTMPDYKAPERERPW